MRILKFFAVLGVAVLMTAQAFGLGSSALAQAKAPAAPEAKVLAVLDIRGLDNLATAVEEVVEGTPLAEDGDVRGQVRIMGGMMLGLDPLEVFDMAAMQRVVAFKRGDDMGVVFVLAPIGGARGLNEQLAKVWGAVEIPEAAAKALPTGTTVYEAANLGTRLFVMPYSPTQVAVLPSDMRAGIRPRELFDLLQSLPQQIAASGQLALRVDPETWRQVLCSENGMAADLGLAFDADDEAMAERFAALDMVSFGLGVRDGALTLDTVVRLAEGSKLANQYAALTGSVTRAASSLWLPGAIAASACHTYPGNSEAMNTAKLSLLDFCTHELPDEAGTVAADIWRLACDLFEPFGPDYGFAMYQGGDGNELPMAFYASLADPSFNGAKAQKFIADLPKRIFKLLGQVVEDDSFGAGRSEPLPVIFDYVETEKVEGVPVDTWNIVLTDCSENSDFPRPLPFTLGTFKVAYLPDAIIIGDGGSDTDIGLTAILRRVHSPDAPLLAETAPFKEAMPFDATEAQNIGYVQVFDVARSIVSFVSRVSQTSEPPPFELPEGPGTVSYACQQPQPGILRQTLGISVKAIRDIIEATSAPMAAPVAEDDDGDWPEDDGGFEE